MTMHAFLDESQRDRLYLVCVTLVDPAQLATSRRHMRGLLLPGQRELHCKSERETRRKRLADEVVGMPLQAHVYRRWCPSRSAHAAARQSCLARATQDLLQRRTRRLVLDSREAQDRDDRRTIQRVLGPHPSRTELVYEHLDSASEPLLWTTDIIAWCYGAGGQWRQRIAPVIASVIDL